MAKFEYKCVVVPRVIEVGKKDALGDAVRAYQHLINQSASDGWEYVGVDEIISYQEPGCLAGLFGKKEKTINFKVLVFKKAKRISGAKD